MFEKFREKRVLTFFLYFYFERSDQLCSLETDRILLA